MGHRVHGAAISQFLAHASSITPIRVIRVDRVLKISIILREPNEVSQFR